MFCLFALDVNRDLYRFIVVNLKMASEFSENEPAGAVVADFAIIL